MKVTTTIEFTDEQLEVVNRICDKKSWSYEKFVQEVIKLYFEKSDELEILQKYVADLQKRQKEFEYMLYGNTEERH